MSSFVRFLSSDDRAWYDAKLRDNPRASDASLAVLMVLGQAATLTESQRDELRDVLVTECPFPSELLGLLNESDRLTLEEEWQTFQASKAPSARSHYVSVRSLEGSTHRTVAVFLESVSEDEHMCGICYEIADQPVTCGSHNGCAAQFCFSCLSRSNQESKNLGRHAECPICKWRMYRKPPVKSLQLRNILDKKLVYCVHSAEAELLGLGLPEDEEHCGWQGKLGDLQSHVKSTCGCVVVRCGNAGCDTSVIRAKMSAHKELCAHEPSPCEHCSEPVARIAMQQHVDRDCPLVPVPDCQCGVQLKRGDVENHNRECELTLCCCSFAGYGCDVGQVRRRDLDFHLHEYQIQHTLLMAKRIQELERKQTSTSALLESGFTWRVTGMRDKLALAASESVHLNSALFLVPEPAGGLSKCYARIKIDKNKLGLHFHKKSAQHSSGSSSDCDISVDGWRVTLKNGARTRTHVLPKLVITSSSSKGWGVFVDDLTPFVTPGDSLLLSINVGVSALADRDLTL